MRTYIPFFKDSLEFDRLEASMLFAIAAHRQLHEWEADDAQREDVECAAEPHCVAGLFRLIKTRWN